MRCLAAAVLLVVLPMLSLPAEAAPKSKLWPRWTAHDAASNRVIDHGAWAKFLNTYLVADEDGIEPNFLSPGHTGRQNRALRII